MKEGYVIRKSNHWRRPWRCRVMASIVACGVAVTLTACASAGGASQQSNSKVLTFADWELLEPGNGPRITAAVESYEKTHPGVTIQTIGYPNDTFESTLETQLGAQSGPDIFPDSGDLMYSGDVYPITLTKAEEKTLIPQNSAGIVDGKRLGVVWEVYDDDLLYNKNIFKKAGIGGPPATFNQFLNDCMTIKQKTGLYGYVGRNMLNEESDWYYDWSYTWLAGFGGSWLNKAGQWTIDAPANITALIDFKKTYDSGCMETGQTAAVFRTEFEAGQVGMLMDNLDAAYTYPTASGSVLSNSVMGGASVPFPTHNGGSNAIILMINRYAPNKALAENFIQWLMSPAGQQALIPGIEPMLPGTTDATSPASFTSSHPWSAPFMADMGKSPDVGTTFPRPQLTNAFHDFVMPYLENVLQGQSSPAAALQSAQAAAIEKFGN
jgi:multiple sugar transport system substrate-binding protein